MFYYLYNLKEHFFIFNVLRYITFRAAYASITSLLITFFFGRKFINYLKRRKFSERISPFLQETHSNKEGTPSFGGIILLVSVIISVLLWSDLGNRFIQYMLFVTIFMGGLGIWDDYRKYVKGEGLRPFLKILMQSIPCVIIGTLLLIYPVKEGYTTLTSVLFFKNTFINLGWFYLPFIILVVIATSNSVNLSDGLDGLAIGLSSIIAVTFVVIAYIAGNIKISSYLNILYIEGSGELSVYLAAFLGSAIGFLWFNSFPAEIFMGDTGSLMIGGILGMTSVLVKQEILFFIVSGVFVIEALSVILQVFTFKTRKKRLFLMAPIHHHFQRRGWSEPKVVVRFWILGILFALLGLSTLKIR